MHLLLVPWDGGIVNIPAVLIVVLMSIFLISGTEGSSIFNGFIVFLKVAVILTYFRSIRLEIHQYRKLYSLYSCQYRYFRRVRILGRIAWSSHCIFCLSWF